MAKKYGDDFNNIVRFSPDPNNRNYDIYGKPNKSAKKTPYSNDKSSKRNTEIYSNSKKNKKLQKSKKKAESKVVKREKKRAFFQRLKPSRAHSRVIFVMIASAVILVLFIGYFYLSSKIAQVQYKNIELQKEYEVRVYEKQELEAQLESANSSSLIEKIAREQLGMVYPQPSQIVYIDTE